MSVRTRLDAALARHRDGPVHVELDGGRAEVDVDTIEAIGVRVRGVRVHHDAPRDVVREAARLPHALRSLPEPVVPVEVDPTLGGATLRTDPDALDGEFTEVDVRPDHTAISRHRVDPTGQRAPTPWDLNRDQLARVIDGASRRG